MRPKKKILLVGASEDRLSILRFMLDTNGFAVTAVVGAAAAIEQLRAQTYELLFCEHWPLPGIEHLLNQAYEIDPAMRSLVLAPGLTSSPAGLNTDAVLLRGGCSSFELLERVKILTARKRGPRSIRKQPIAVPVPLMSTADRRLA
jgi:CheY-like chemotaxis protein